jgi:hypothetical protein
MENYIHIFKQMRTNKKIREGRIISTLALIN